MENRGQELLKRWLDGDVNYLEEVELFELAERDVMLREALEGYIGQDVYEVPAFPLEVVSRVEAAQRRIAPKRRTMVWLRYVAGILLLVAVGQAVWVNNNGRTGTAAEPSADIVSVNAPDVYETVQAEEAEEAELPVLQRPASRRVFSMTVLKGNTTEQHAPADRVAAPVAETQGVELPALQTMEVVALQGQQKGLLLSLDDPLENEEVVSREETAVAYSRSLPVATNIGLEYFDHEADEVLRSGIKFDENAAGDDVITGYEIDVVAGIQPGSRTGFDADTSMRKKISAPMDLVDASGVAQSRSIKENKISNEVVIREYEIQRKDIIDPPMQDFNSLVREKYKRKAKPVDGFYQYRKYLKNATQCMVDGMGDVGHLEEAILKFRVFQDGRIEFIEFFGTRDSDCVERVSAEVIGGPKWDVKEFYESIDIEVPFKVLYPYLF